MQFSTPNVRHICLITYMYYPDANVMMVNILESFNGLFYCLLDFQLYDKNQIKNFSHHKNDSYGDLIICQIYRRHGFVGVIPTTLMGNGYLVDFIFTNLIPVLGTLTSIFNQQRKQCTTICKHVFML